MEAAIYLIGGFFAAYLALMLVAFPVWLYLEKPWRWP